MKTNELLVLSVLATALHNEGFCQMERSPFTSSDSLSTLPVTSQPNVFRLFTGGINAIYSDDQARGGIDLSVQTYHYFLVTGDRKDSDTTKKKQFKGGMNTFTRKDQFKGFDFFLLNRASIDFDTSKSIANDYITSMQASPLTLRFVKEYFLTKHHSINALSYAPVISIRLTGDGRAVPYSDQRQQVGVGASGHFFVTFSTQFTRLEFDQKGKEMDRGTMYIQPSVGIAIGNNQLMKSIYEDHTNKVLLSSECRLGFKSHAKTVNDCSLLVRYTPSNVIGPKLRAGIILSSFN